MHLTVKRTAICCALVLAGCDREAVVNGSTDTQRPPELLPLSLSPLQLEARRALERRVEEKAALKVLEGKVSKAMQTYLIDPFSAKYAKLKAGKGGAICGEVNAKNRMGAYVGSKPFVLESDGQTILVGKYADGIASEWFSAFAESYVAACATDKERRQYSQDTYIEPYSPTSSSSYRSGDETDFEGEMEKKEMNEDPFAD